MATLVPVTMVVAPIPIVTLLVVVQFVEVAVLIMPFA